MFAGRERGMESLRRMLWGSAMPRMDGLFVSIPRDLWETWFGVDLHGVGGCWCNGVVRVGPNPRFRSLIELKLSFYSVRRVRD